MVSNFFLGDKDELGPSVNHNLYQESKHGEKGSEQHKGTALLDQDVRGLTEEDYRRLTSDDLMLVQEGSEENKSKISDLSPLIERESDNTDISNDHQRRIHGRRKIHSRHMRSEIKEISSKETTQDIKTLEKMTD